MIGKIIISNLWEEIGYVQLKSCMPSPGKYISSVWCVTSITRKFREKKYYFRCVLAKFPGHVISGIIYIINKMLYGTTVNNNSLDIKASVT